MSYRQQNEDALAKIAACGAVAAGILLAAGWGPVPFFVILACVAAGGAFHDGLGRGPGGPTR